MWCCTRQNEATKRFFSIIVLLTKSDIKFLMQGKENTNNIFFKHNIVDDQILEKAKHKRKTKILICMTENRHWILVFASFCFVFSICCFLTKLQILQGDWMWYGLPFFDIKPIVWFLGFFEWSSYREMITSLFSNQHSNKSLQTVNHLAIQKQGLPIIKAWFSACKI